VTAARRRKLFEQNLPWVRVLARKAIRRLPPSFDVEDLFQIGAAKMWEKIPDWDASRGVPLQGFLVSYVYNQMLMSARGPKYRDATRPPIPDSATTEVSAIDTERAQRFAILADLINGLDAPERDLLHAHFWEGERLTEIAKGRRVTLPALKSECDRVLSVLACRILDREPELLED